MRAEMPVVYESPIMLKQVLVRKLGDTRLVDLMVQWLPVCLTLLKMHLSSQLLTLKLKKSPWSMRS